MHCKYFVDKCRVVWTIRLLVAASKRKCDAAYVVYYRWQESYCEDGSVVTLHHCCAVSETSGSKTGSPRTPWGSTRLMEKHFGLDKITKVRAIYS